MRLALGFLPDPAFFMNIFINAPLIAPPVLSVPGPSVSATSTSPLGRTYSQRGCSRAPPKSLTLSPAAGVGICPAAQPSALATLTVGSNDLLGAGSRGVGPIARSTGTSEVEPHALSARVVARTDTKAMERMTNPPARRSFHGQNKGRAQRMHLTGGGHALGGIGGFQPQLDHAPRVGLDADD